MPSRFNRILETLPASLRAALLPIVCAPEFSASFTPRQVATICAQSKLDLQSFTLALLPLAASYARSPLSGFNVGAIARGVSGHLWLGANMEFGDTTLQQTVHAEQSAIVHAWMQGEDSLLDITVNCTPCGHCRQFMNELNCGPDLIIQLPDRPAAPLSHYLPHAFGPQDLNVTSLLMDNVNHAMQAEGDELTMLALKAANRSYAPYTAAWSGLALETYNSIGSVVPVLKVPLSIPACPRFRPRSLCLIWRVNPSGTYVVPFWQNAQTR